MAATRFLTTVARSVHHALFHGADVLKQVRCLTALRCRVAPRSWPQMPTGAVQCTCSQAQAPTCQVCSCCLVRCGLLLPSDAGLHQAILASRCIIMTPCMHPASAQPPPCLGLWVAGERLASGRPRGIPGRLRQVCENIVIPNIRIRADQEEMFEMNWVEYVRRDTEGSDSDTRRRAATELVRALTERFPTEARSRQALRALCLCTRRSPAIELSTALHIKFSPLVVVCLSRGLAGEIV